MSNTTKHSHPLPSRSCLSGLALPVLCLFCKRRTLLPFFFLLSTVAGAQFFVGKDTSISIDAGGEVYVGYDTVFLYSRIENGGVLILDHTQALYIHQDDYREGIAFINNDRLEIIKSGTIKSEASNPRSKSAKRQCESAAIPKGPEVFPFPAGPFNRGAICGIDQSAIASTSFSHDFKKTAVAASLGSNPFEQSYGYTPAIACRQYYLNLTLDENKMSTNSARPPPHFYSSKTRLFKCADAMGPAPAVGKGQTLV